ncbi:PleD family two-component response regulator [Sphingopyxis sp. OAS728]|uniref:hypothetical protein n=1 Tax=Sphingopyxis sp. OAS728 TaxID=2663823 RepID=UPI00178A5E4C|nr:hypothetical protein [Sphingopyxis sp. OAS728]MBE1529730.1 PleD family two-component response regulator [Sphingopyxis sp. OAS728]
MLARQNAYYDDVVTPSVRAFSFGFASCQPVPGGAAAQPGDAADAALYRAKAGGKARALFCIEADAAEAELAA